jgi:hypothetical protein
VIVPAALLVLLCVAGFGWWVRQAAANRRIIGMPGGEPDELFRGGVMGRHILTSGSLARLELYDWGVRLHGMALFGWIVPTWEATYDQLAMAELITLPHSRITVWLRLSGDPHAIGFLSQHSEEILTLLQQHDVPVNRAVTQVSRVEELYQ